MLTYEQIDNIKEGDTLYLAVILERKITHGAFKVKTDKDSCVTASTIRLFLPSEHGTSVPTPKYDPNRLFKKGDKVKPAERHGRKTPKLNYKAEYTVTSSEDDYGAVGVEYFNGAMTVCVSIPFYWLELVTPVEELEPYYVERQGEKSGGLCYTVRKHGGYVESIFYFGEYRSRDEQQAKAAAEAERARLNAEWREEQNRD